MRVGGIWYVCALLSAGLEIVAAGTVDDTFGPAQVFDGLGEGFQVGDVGGFRVPSDFLLDVGEPPEVFLVACL